MKVICDNIKTNPVINFKDFCVNNYIEVPKDTNESNRNISEVEEAQSKITQKESHFKIPETFTSTFNRPFIISGEKEKDRDRFLFNIIKTEKNKRRKLTQSAIANFLTQLFKDAGVCLFAFGT